MRSAALLLNFATNEAEILVVLNNLPADILKTAL